MMHFRKWILFFVLAVLLVLPLFGFAEGDIQVKSIQLVGQTNEKAAEKTTITEVKIGVGAKTTVTAEVLPEDAKNKKLNWTSSDTNIAKVSAKGEISGRGVGTATITCEAMDGSGVSATLNVTVFQPVKGLKLDKNKITVYAGKLSDPLVVTVNPADAEYQDVTWTSSDESIATVNEKGQVKGIANGKVKITATSNEPGKAPKSVICQVTVVQAVEYIGLSEGKSTNNSLTLNLTVLPETATNKKVEWKSSDSSIATVSNGKVRIRKHEGYATITATAKDGSGVYASCEISVSFSGMVIRSGNYEQRWGTYGWNVGGFYSSGTIADNPVEDNSVEEKDAAVQWFETGLGKNLPVVQLQSEEKPKLNIVTDNGTQLDFYVVNAQLTDFNAYTALLEAEGYTVDKIDYTNFTATSKDIIVYGSFIKNDAGFGLQGMDGTFYEVMELFCEPASAET